MNRIIGILLLTVSPLLISASIYNNVKPDLIVQSKSGLKLRLNPDLNAPVLSVIAYGETVKILEDEDFKEFNVSWVSGKWVKVEHDFHTGYVFNGFLSELPVPTLSDEFASRVEDLSFAIYNYSHLKFQNFGTDTLNEEENSVTTLSKMDTHDLFVHESTGVYKVDLTLSGLRIMDAYNLLENMMDSRSARTILKENSVFFRDHNGQVNKIKINGDILKIERTADGDIKISSRTIFEGC